MKKSIVFDNSDMNIHTREIIRQLHLDNWSPDYVVGVNKDGIFPAMLISEYMNIPMYTLMVTDDDPETNAWMAEDAFGYSQDRMNILIVIGVNDSQSRISWIKNDWRGSCLPNNNEWDETIFGYNVRFAAIVNHIASDQEVNYHSIEINDTDNEYSIEFPHNNWWRKS